jgi:hypothetical protein
MDIAVHAGFKLARIGGEFVLHMRRPCIDAFEDLSQRLGFMEAGYHDG